MAGLTIRGYESKYSTWLRLCNPTTKILLLKGLGKYTPLTTEIK